MIYWLKEEVIKTADISYEKTYFTPENDFKMTYSLQSGPVGATVLSYMPEAGKRWVFYAISKPFSCRRCSG